MKIGVIGTRGIPNRYGGFEQFIMEFSEYLIEKGHDVTVYSISNHSYKKTDWKGVKLIHKWNPENIFGAAGQFIYDFLCILDSRKRNYDIVLQLGYTSSSIWKNLLPKKAIIVTNMDGMEWKRSKYSPLVKKFLKKAESWAVKGSDYLIADSLGIQKYLNEKYQVNAAYIAYGSNLFQNPEVDFLHKYHLKPQEYCLIIARMQEDNNVETIIKGFLNAKTKKKLVVIGDCKNAFGNYLQTKYQSDLIIFLGGIYDRDELDNLRYYSYFYFHGHSVGGTNPSLIEAMSCKTTIVAYKNIFNASILENDSYYFTTNQDITRILNNEHPNEQFKINNYEKVKTIYSLESIHRKTENYLLSCLEKKN